MNYTGNVRTSHCPWFVFLSDLLESLQGQPSIFARVVLWRGCLHKVKIDSGWDDQQPFHDMRINFFLQEKGVSNMCQPWLLQELEILFICAVCKNKTPSPGQSLQNSLRFSESDNPSQAHVRQEMSRKTFAESGDPWTWGDSGRLSGRNATTKLWQEGVLCKQGKMPCSELTQESTTWFTLSWCLC